MSPPLPGLAPAATLHLLNERRQARFDTASGIFRAFLSDDYYLKERIASGVSYRTVSTTLPIFWCVST